MHSLRNTVVAVGLLGLSFLFYQASSSNPSDSAEMIPVLEISDGLDGIKELATGGIDAAQAKLDSLPVKIPDLSQPKQMASDLAANIGSNINAKTAQLEKSANSFVDNAFSSPGKSPAVSPSGDFSADILPGSPTKQASNLGADPLKIPPTLPPVQRKPLDNESRDAGLIGALQSQKQTSPVQPPADNSFGSEPATEADDEHQFTSQPIHSSDSSYNRLATDNSINSDSAIAHADSEPDPANLNFQSAWPHVDRLIAEDKFREALLLLSQYYQSPDLTGPQRQRLIGWLDALAGKVIFSAEHHLEDMPLTVANESLVDIAERWKVPTQLIYNINRDKLPNPASVAPGTSLKIVRGPFNAEIDMDQKIMTLFLGELYAGRYPIRIGVSGTPKPGSFRVLVKSAAGHNWRDAEGKDYPPDAPENGYGPNWIGLSGSLCIHAIEESDRDGHRGCIGLSAEDAKDVFAILSEGSNVKILR